MSHNKLTVIVARKPEGGSLIASIHAVHDYDCRAWRMGKSWIAEKLAIVEHYAKD